MLFRSGATPAIAGDGGGQLACGSARIGSGTEKERHGEGEELTGNAVMCSRARGERRWRRIRRRRRAAGAGRERAAAVLQAVGARFPGGGGREEVGGAGGGLGWARGAPERRRPAVACSVRVWLAWEAHRNGTREEGEGLGVLRGCETDGDATPSLSARGEASRARQQGCCLPACFTSMDYWHEEDMKNP